MAEREGVDVRLYTIIYDLIGDVRAALEGLLEPEVAEHITGRAEVRETYHIPRIGVVAGCYVTEGTVTRNAECRLCATTSWSIKDVSPRSAASRRMSTK